MISEEVKKAHEHLKHVPISTEAKTELEFAKDEIDRYDDSEFSPRLKNQVKETLAQYSTYNFIARQLKEGKSAEDIEGISVDKQSVEESLNAIDIIVLTGMWQKALDK